MTWRVRSAGDRLYSARYPEAPGATWGDMPAPPAGAQGARGASVYLRNLPILLFVKALCCKGFRLFPVPFCHIAAASADVTPGGCVP